VARFAIQTQPTICGRDLVGRGLRILELLDIDATQPYRIAYTNVRAALTGVSARQTSTSLRFAWKLTSFGETVPQGVSR
jgi:hypothetical protein